MLAQLTSVTRNLWSALAEGARKLQALREKYRTIEEIREVRGRNLLREWLSPRQKEQFDVSGVFEVVGCDSGKRYRIRHGRSTNVLELDNDGHPVMGWCFIPHGDLVSGDVMLAQKLALETSEHAALAVANRFPVRSNAR
jgi:hypothetical protein